MDTRERLVNIGGFSLLFVGLHVLAHATGLLPYRSVWVCLGGLALLIVLCVAFKLGASLGRKFFSKVVS